MKAYRITGIVFGLILLILFLTNPSMKEFEDFIGYRNGQTRIINITYPARFQGKHLLTRKANVFIYSKFEWNGKTYIGILNNFYEL